MNHLRLLHWLLPAAVICLLGLAGGIPAVAETITPTSQNFSLTEGIGGTSPLGTFTDSNTSLSASDFIATVNWGDGGPATPASVAPTGNPGQFNLLGSHTYVEEGTYSAVVTISDSGASADLFDTATVADAPLNAGIEVDFSTPPGVVFNGEVGSFEDSNPSGTVSDFSSPIINWGDGSPTSSGTVTASSGVFLVSGSHDYLLPGSYSVTVQVSDDGGSHTSLVGSAEVTTAPEPCVWVLVCAGLALIGLRARVTSQAG